MVDDHAISCIRHDWVMRDPVLSDNAQTTKRKDERCLLLVVSDRDPQHLFRAAALRICDRYPDGCGINRQRLESAEVKTKIKCFGQRKRTRRRRERISGLAHNRRSKSPQY
jgi:hypothetical protein